MAGSALAQVFEIPCALLAPILASKREPAAGPGAGKGKETQLPTGRWKMTRSRQHSKVGCCQLPFIIPALHQKAEMKVSGHGPRHNNVDPPPEITASLKEVAFA